MSVEKEDFSLSRTRIDFSVPSGTDVVIGQEFMLDITISSISGTPLPSDINVELRELVGLKIDPNYFGSPSYLKNGMVFQKRFLLAIDDTIKPGHRVSYSIKYGDFFIPVNYHARDLDINSVKLTADKLFIAMPNRITDPSDKDTKYIRFSEKLMDSSGLVMKNTPIMIISSLQGEIGSCIFTTDPIDDSQSSEVLSPVTVGSKIFITVHSDDTGHVRFRLYPKRGFSVTLQLLNVIGEIAIPGDEVYVVDSYDSRLPKVIIPDLKDGILCKGYPPEFEVKLPSYGNETLTDRVVFFTNIKDGVPDSDSIVLSSTIKNYSEPYHVYSLKYNEFPVNKESKLFYVILTSSGNNAYSYNEELKCMWKELSYLNQ
ncbi:hypothetical protein [Xenorhabdus bovienii]|uniref:hypothetical protein n=1 Tax=Xenorhabdus bovienii TaxID=40576 RepID=UPI00237D0D38|nr:hypothetical protein [Xenorhabdus bovienii]MDE1483615.1 hypothetical protein [Xenorhabdus bovienii]MDE9429769.1 hypothetical protein [Xenorhabdus bovienii]MDE9442853.1 hypothetical protein [Xenorhabdus bovienii]